jgi:hypothetical protein
MSVSSDSKRERRLAARAERMRQAEAGRQRAQRRRRLTLGGAILAAVALLVALGFFLTQSFSQPSLGRAVPDEGREHVTQGTPLEFSSNPPASGTHYAVWTRPGVYQEAQPEGNWVHSLEHGYVVVLYNCPTECPELREQLRAFYEAAPKSRKYNYQKLIVQPSSEIEHPIVAVAWNRVLELEQFDADQLAAFFRAYADKGPEDAA